MNPMRAVVVILALLALCLGLNAQERILRDAAAAATGGTGGVAAGTKMGKGVSSIFGKVDGGTAKAAAVEGTRKTPVILEEEAGTEPADAKAPETAANPIVPDSSRKARPRAAAARTAKARRSRSRGTPEYLAPAFDRPQAPTLTKDDLRDLDVGVEREQLVAKLGRPSARVFIPEDGYLHEVYLFSGSGMHLGTVELNDGAVTAVNVSAF